MANVSAVVMIVLAVGIAVVAIGAVLMILVKDFRRPTEPPIERILADNVATTIVRRRVMSGERIVKITNTVKTDSVTQCDGGSDKSNDSSLPPEVDKDVVSDTTEASVADKASAVEAGAAGGEIEVSDTDPTQVLPLKSEKKI